MASSDLDPATSDSTRLHEWLSHHLTDAPLTVRPLPGGRSNPTYEVSTGSSAWILRRPPLNVPWSAAHDVVREAAFLSALANSEVPVPEVTAVCQDTSVIGCPFYLMERIDGRTLRDYDDTAALSEAEHRGLSTTLVDTLAALHSIDPSSVGLAAYGRPTGYLERQLRRWTQQWDRVATSGRGSVDAIHARLSRTLPATSMPGIVHGDFKLDNVMVANEQPAHIVAVLDWEMATHGDVLADLGWLLSLWDEPGEEPNPISAGATAHPGFLTRTEVVDHYASLRSCDVSDLNWYVAFSHFKLAVILEQIHHRSLHSAPGADAADSEVGGMVEPLLQRAADAMP